MAFFVVVPLVNVFVQALAGGVGVYWRNLTGDADTLHSIKLTLIVAPIAVGLNVTFGIAAACALAPLRPPGPTLPPPPPHPPLPPPPLLVGRLLPPPFPLPTVHGTLLQSVSPQRPP